MQERNKKTKLNKPRRSIKPQKYLTRLSVVVVVVEVGIAVCGGDGGVVVVVVVVVGGGGGGGGIELWPPASVAARTCAGVAA